MKASWDPADGDVVGYRVRCRRQAGPSTLLSVSPQIHSVLLSDLAAGTTNKVCIKPVYKNLPGKGLCKMVHIQPGKFILAFSQPNCTNKQTHGNSHWANGIARGGAHHYELHRASLQYAHGLSTSSSEPFWAGKAKLPRMAPKVKEQLQTAVRLPSKCRALHPF